MAAGFRRSWMRMMARSCARWSRRRTMRPWRSTPRPLPPGLAKRSVNRVFVGRCGAMGWLLKKTLRASEQLIPMPESSDLSLMTDSVGKGRFPIPCHRSELIGSGIRPDVAAERDDFRKDIAAIDPNRLIFLDESGILT